MIVMSLCPERYGNLEILLATTLSFLYNTPQLQKDLTLKQYCFSMGRHFRAHADKPQVASRSRQKVVTMNKGPDHILIIEDNPFDFKMASRLLARHQDLFTIEWACTLKQGLTALNSSRFDLLLLDLNLPDSRGIETLKPIREKVPTLPVIVLTSQDDESFAIEALKSGAQDYLIKGKIDRSLLERSIRYAIERQQTAIRLKTQNDFLLSILESLTHPFIVVNTDDLAIPLANSAAKSEWFKESLCCADPGSPGKRPYLCTGRSCPVKIVAETKKPLITKHQHTDGHGTERTQEIHAFPVFDQDHAVSQVIVYFMDTTEKENSKRESRRLSTVVQQSSDSILIMDTHETIRYVNPAFERMAGYSRDELLGKPYGMLLSQKHTREFFHGIKACLAQGESWSGVLISKKKDGTLYEEEVELSPVKNEQDRIISYVSTSRDITSKKRLESIAEAANLMTNIGYIFSGIRHEIGNPINSIKMALTVLNNHITTYSIDMIKEFTERCLDEVLRVEYLLKGLRNFSMYESLDIGKISVDECVKNFTNLIRDDFSSKNIAIHLELPPETVYACADPRALHQVLLNLVTNAADALVSVTEPRIVITLEKKMGLAIIHVRDNGCGMSAEERSNLFKPFHTSKRSGTGLGLVIVKKMLSTMNGTIKVQSEKNKGTTVMIFIPEDCAAHEEKTSLDYR